MTKTHKILLAAVALLGSAVALAATVNVSWTNATSNTDTSAIPATGPGSIASTRITYGTCAGTAFGTKIGEVVVQGAAQAGSIPNLAPGTYCAYAQHTNTYGNEGAASNVAQKIVPAPIPNAPTGFTLS